jgi:acyl-CoA synthetase (AMP-forming)/AMP-acid ligase II
MTEPLDLNSSFRNVGSKGKNLNATMLPWREIIRETQTVAHSIRKHGGHLRQQCLKKNNGRILHH